jgi:hypothetical protein
MKAKEAVRHALLELGNAPAEQLASFIARQYGVRIEARYIPQLLAAIKDRETLLRGR